MKKFLSIVLGTAICVPMAFGFAGCGPTTNKVDVVAKDVYAMSAFSSVSYLQGKLNTKSSRLLNAPLLSNSDSRPASILDDDIAGVKNCLVMFEQILQNGIQQTTYKNTESSTELSVYNFVMEISLPSQSGIDSYLLYYNETETETEREIEDEKEEVETSTKLEGVILAGDNLFQIKGERNFETEGDESEASIEFTTYIDSNNYVIIEQSVEAGEIEYEYTIYENGQKLQNVEFEMETENNKHELEFKIKNLSTGLAEKTTYKLDKKDENLFDVIIQKNNSTENFVVEILAEGFKFIYENGFTEIINL